MEKKIILRLSNGLGNQMFMYATAYSLAKRLNRKLIIDDETAFRARKNISKYALSNFEITSEIAPNSNKFKSNIGYLKRKSFKFLDKFMIKKKISNPVFCLWSNDIENINLNDFSAKITKIIHNNEFYNSLDQNSLDLYLITQAKHHIVIPSTFNWWGAWLCSNKEKIILRPSSNYFSQFKINNNDFWPDTWLKINK